MKKVYITLFSLLCILFYTHRTSAAIVMVEVEDFEFNPTIFTVSVGDTITWFWEEGFHTTTSTMVPAGAAPWDAPINSSSPLFFYIATVPGSYDYQCSPHGSMGMLGHFTVTGTTTNVIENSAPSLDFISNSTSNGALSITYALPAVSTLGIKLYDILGNTAQTFALAKKPAGTHVQSLDVATLPKGVYILELTTSDARLARKIMIE